MERLVPTQLTNPADANYLKNLTATVNYITSNGGYAILDPYVVFYSVLAPRSWQAQGMAIAWPALAASLRFYIVFTPKSRSSLSSH